MSEDPGHGAKKSPASKDIHTDKGGGGSKWLIGAAAAVILAGAGVLAWQNFSPSQSSNMQAAYNDDPYQSEPLNAGPIESGSDLNAESAAADDVIAPPPAASETPRRAPARRQVASAEAVPEQTIGITPASATTAAADDNELVVTARRPIWTQTPSARRLSALYPANALDRGREGEARLACVVEDRGVLDCENTESTPGFRNAALRVARTFRHSTTLANGESAVGTPVNLRVVFRIQEEERGRRFASR